MKDGKLTISDAAEKTENVRAAKGRSLLECVSEYTAVDIETTGLNPKYDDIIEIGAVKFRGGKAEESFQSLINPGYKISNEIIRLTGITNQMLSKAKPVYEVLLGFLEFAEDSIIVGHNVNFDISFISNNCMSYFGRPFENDFIDTMRLSRNLFPEEGHHRLCDLINRFSVAETVEHRALSDAIQTAMCYEYMKEYTKEKGINLSYFRSGRNKRAVSPPVLEESSVDYDSDSNFSFVDKVFVLTGTFKGFSREELQNEIVSLGGKCSSGITKKVDYLVVGYQDVNVIKNKAEIKSTKILKAEELRSGGGKIKIIPDEDFISLLKEKKSSLR